MRLSASPIHSSNRVTAKSSVKFPARTYFKSAFATSEQKRSGAVTIATSSSFAANRGACWPFRTRCTAPEASRTARAVNAPGPHGSGPRERETVEETAPSRSSSSAPPGLRAAVLSPSARESAAAPRWPAARGSDARPELGTTEPRRRRRVNHGSVGIASVNLLRFHHSACILQEQRVKCPGATRRKGQEG